MACQGLSWLVLSPKVPMVGTAAWENQDSGSPTALPSRACPPRAVSPLAHPVPASRTSDSRLPPTLASGKVLAEQRPVRCPQAWPVAPMGWQHTLASGPPCPGKKGSQRPFPRASSAMPTWGSWEEVLGDAGGPTFPPLPVPCCRGGN